MMKQRTGRYTWDVASETALIAAVRKHGHRWKQILEDPQFAILRYIWDAVALQRRTDVHDIKQY